MSDFVIVRSCQISYLSDHDISWHLMAIHAISWQQKYVLDVIGEIKLQAKSKFNLANKGFSCKNRLFTVSLNSCQVMLITQIIYIPCLAVSFTCLFWRGFFFNFFHIYAKTIGHVEPNCTL
jgi:hypothetical protein